MTPPQTDLFGDPVPDIVDAAEALHDDPGRWPRQMAEITDILADELTRTDSQMESVAARRMACRLMARIAREFGGGGLYIPKTDALERTLRDERLWAEYDGTVDGPHGIHALARREGLTAIHTYRIIAAQRALHRASTQLDLFQHPPPGLTAAGGSSPRARG